MHLILIALITAGMVGLAMLALRQYPRYSAALLVGIVLASSVALAYSGNTAINGLTTASALGDTNSVACEQGTTTALRCLMSQFVTYIQSKVQPVSGGGTGQSTLAVHGVVLGNGSSGVNVTGAGSSTQVFTSNGGSADPTFQAPAAPSITFAASCAGVVTTGSGTASLTVGTTLPINAQTGTSYTVVAGDNCKMMTFSNASAIAVTLPQAGSAGFGTGWSACAAAIGAGTVTITTTTSNFNGGPSTFVLTGATAGVTAGKGGCFGSDGTNWILPQ